MNTKEMIGASVILLFALLGIAFFAATPITLGEESYHDSFGNWYNGKIRVFGFGNGKIDQEGEFLGIPIPPTATIESDDWEVYGKAFPAIVPTFVTIGFVISLLAGGVLLAFSFIDDIKIVKKIAIILGIFGGIIALTGILIFVQWGKWFLSKFENASYNIGFIFTILVSIIMIVSFTLVGTFDPAVFGKKQERI